MISEDANGKTFKYYLKLNINCTFMPYLFAFMFPNQWNIGSNPVDIDYPYEIEFKGYPPQYKGVFHRPTKLETSKAKFIKVKRTNYLPKTINKQALEQIRMKRDPNLDFSNEPYSLINIFQDPRRYYSGFKIKFKFYRTTSIPGSTDLMTEDNRWLFLGNRNTDYDANPSTPPQPQIIKKNFAIRWYVWRAPSTGVYIMVPSFGRKDPFVPYSIFTQNVRGDFAIDVNGYLVTNDSRLESKTRNCYNTDKSIEDLLLKNPKAGEWASEKNFVGVFHGFVPQKGSWIEFSIPHDENYVWNFFGIMWGDDTRFLELGLKEFYETNWKAIAIAISWDSNYPLPNIANENNKNILKLTNFINLNSNTDNTDNHLTYTAYSSYLLRNMYFEDLGFGVIQNQFNSELNKWQPRFKFPDICIFSNSFSYLYYTNLSNQNNSLTFVESDYVNIDNFVTYMNSVRNTQNTGIEVAKFQKEKDELIGYGSILPNMFSLNFGGAYANLINAVAAENEYQNTIKMQDAKNLDMKNSAGSRVVSSSNLKDAYKNTLFNFGLSKIAIIPNDWISQQDLDSMWDVTNGVTTKFHHIYSNSCLIQIPTDTQRIMEFERYCWNYGMYVDEELNVSEFYDLFRLNPVYTFAYPKFDWKTVNNPILYNAWNTFKYQDDLKEKYVYISSRTSQACGAPFWYLDAEFPEWIINTCFFWADIEYRKLINQFFQNSVRWWFNKMSPETFFYSYQLAPMEEWADDIPAQPAQSQEELLSWFDYSKGEIVFAPDFEEKMAKLEAESKAKKSSKKKGKK